jgi:hypothetical protein
VVGVVMPVLPMPAVVVRVVVLGVVAALVPGVVVPGVVVPGVVAVGMAVPGVAVLRPRGRGRARRRRGVGAVPHALHAVDHGRVHPHRFRVAGVGGDHAAHQRDLLGLVRDDVHVH